MIYFSVLNCFTPSLHALPVVIMELWSPLKMSPTVEEMSASVEKLNMVEKI